MFSRGDRLSFVGPLVAFVPYCTSLVEVILEQVRLKNNGRNRPRRYALGRSFNR
jgi:hypothetical protein